MQAKVNNPLVTIIVPIYNAEAFLHDCIKSIRNQTYNNLQIILVNDGSTDKSLEIIKAHATKDKRISVINQKNSGVCAARNNALKIAKGDYILFADADDELIEKNIESNVKTALANKVDIVVDSYIIRKDSKDKVIKLENNKQPFRDNISDENTRYGGFAWNKFIKHKLISAPFNEKIAYYENLLFFLENTNENTTYTTIEEPLYIYKANENSATHTTNISKRQISAIKALEMIRKIVDAKYKDFYTYRLFVKINSLKYMTRNNSEMSRLLEQECASINKEELFAQIQKSTKLSAKLKARVIVIRWFPALDNLIKRMAS